MLTADAHGHFSAVVSFFERNEFKETVSVGGSFGIAQQTEDTRRNKTTLELALMYTMVPPFCCYGDYDAAAAASFARQTPMTWLMLYNPRALA